MLKPTQDLRPRSRPCAFQDIGRASQRRKLIRGRTLKDAIEPRRNAEPARRRIVDLLQVREQLPHRVAHPLRGTPPNLQFVRHLVQRQALGARGQHPRQP